jgi:hypothetical protein
MRQPCSIRMNFKGSKNPIYNRTVVYNMGYHIVGAVK